MTKLMRQSHWFVLGALVFAVALPFTNVSPTWITLLIFTMIHVMLAQSVNFLSGFAGQFALGQGGFMAIGAYTSALLMMKIGVPFVLSVPAAILMAALFGYAVSLPARRVRELYLAMVTLAFSYLVHMVLKEWRSLTGGFSGVFNIPSPTLDTLEIFGMLVSTRAYYLITLGALVFVSLVHWLIVRSFYGRAMVMVAENELAAASVGIPAGRLKQTAYVISAGTAGLAGSLYAHYITFMNPEVFDPMASVNILVWFILGGHGTMIGPFLGAGLFTILPHELAVFQKYQLVVYGLILFLSYTLLPRGLAGLLRIRTRLAPEPDRKVVNKGPGPAATAVRLVSDNSLLEARQVSKAFSGVQALQDVTMAVRTGSIHGLIGPNGAGKSTLVNVITGVYAPESGSIAYRGESIATIPAPARAELGIRRTFQNPQLPRAMTVMEAVLSGAHTDYRSNLLHISCGLPRAQAEEAAHLAAAMETIEHLHLMDVCDELTTSIPYGKQRMVELGRALLGRPDLLILDEPAAGLSETEMKELSHYLTRLNANGMTILIIEHHMDFLLELVDDVTVLDFGRVIFRGDPVSLRHDQAVEEAYLGGVLLA